MKNNNSIADIDVTITWVDGNDPEWLECKREYMPKKNNSYKASSDESRFRDWNNLQYIFRGIERFMPWVRKVHFVTWGHLPEWLNTSNPKLNIVNHKDYIPEKYLPVFNSNAIELNFNRIEGLSEQFISFNDDFFVIGPTKPTDFFYEGRPRHTAVLTPFVVNPNGIAASEMNNLEIVNKYFSNADIKKNMSKWINIKYGKQNIKTLFFMKSPNINGIYEPHIPLSFLKSTFEMMWEKEYEAMDGTCCNRFRSKSDISLWLMRHWQMLSGEFEPRPYAFGKYLCLPNGLAEVERVLEHPGKCRLLCINDSMAIDDFENIKSRVNNALNKLLPEKSGFEL
ncbi:MAG: capsule biosynthesis protein CapG [Lachnospiraceae bacterium]|nr:capsule biosynthesis protein CapG [Lachnospiraceae bacterium]